MRHLPEVQAQIELEANRRWINLIEIRNRFRDEMEELGAYSDENKRILRELNHQVKGGPDRIIQMDNLKIDILL